MADESVLFTYEGDASANIDELDAMIEAFTAIDEEIQNTAASSEQLSALDDILSSLVDMVTTLEESFTTLSTSVEEMAAMADEAGSALESISAADGVFSDLTAQVEATTEALTAMAEEAAAAGTTTEEATAAASGMGGGGGVAMLGIAVGMATGKILSMGLQAQDSFSLVTGMAGTSTDTLNQMTPALEGMASKYGESMDQVAQGLYQVESAGYNTADSITVEGVAMKESVASHTEFATVASSLTSELHAYGAGADQAGKYSDYMAEAVVRGKQSFSDFASAIGPLAATGANVGISFDQIAAAEATMTQINPHVKQDAVQLQHMLNAVALNADKVASSAHSMGLKFNEAHYNSLDLIGKLEYLHEVSGKNKTDFEKLVGGSSGLAAATDLLNGKSKTYIDNLNAMHHSSGAVDNAFNEHEKTVSAAFDHISANLSIFGYELVKAITPQILPILEQIGNAVSVVSDLILHHTQEMLPVLLALAGVVGGILVGAFMALVVPVLAVAAPFILIGMLIGLVVGGIILVIQHWGEISTWLHDQWQSVLDAISGFWSDTWGRVTSVFNGAVSTLGNDINSVIGFFNQWRTPIEIVAGLITLFFAPALIRAGIEAVTSGAKIAMSFVQSMIKTGSEAAINGAKTSAQFVGSMIKSGTEAVINGAKVTIQFVGSMIKAGAEAVINGAKVTGQFVMSLIKTGAEGWAAAGKLGLFIGNLIATGVQSAIAGAKIAASFVANLVKMGAEAVIAGAKMLVSLVPAIISVATEGAIAAATAIPGLVVGFIAWAGAAMAAAIATIAAAWPILLVIAAVALLVLGIYELVTHWSAVTTFLRTIWQAFTSWLMGALHSIGQFFTNIWNGILDFIKSVWQHIVDFVKQYGILLLAVVLGPIVLIVAFVIQHWSQIVAFLHSVWTTITTLARVYFMLLVVTIQQKLQEAEHFIQDVWNRVVGFLHDIWAKILETVHQLWDDIVNVFSFAWNDLLLPLGRLEDNIIAWFGGLAGKALTWGEDLIKNLISGITNMLGSLGNTVSGVANKIKQFLGFSKPELGPLSDADQWMPDFGDLLERGLRDQSKKLGQASINVAQTLAYAAPAASSTPAPGAGQQPTGGPMLILLAQILGAIQQGQVQQSHPGNIPSSITQYNNNALYGNQSLQDLYNQIDALAGIRNEAGARGAF